MAGFWIKFDTSTSDKPEVCEMADRLEIDPDAVVGKLLRVWAWFDDHSESGNAPRVTKTLLDRRVGVTGFCDAMIEAGWMAESGNEISLPNFDRHNGKTAKTRALSANRTASHRKRNAKCNAASVTEARPETEQSRAEGFSGVESQPRDPSKGKAQAEKATTRSAREKAFSRFWGVYPTKAAKKDAVTAFGNAFDRLAKVIGEQAAEDKLVQAAADYADYLAGSPDPPKVKYAQGWLNHARYEDDYVEMLEQARRSSSGKGESRDERNKRVFDEFFGPDEPTGGNVPSDQAIAGWIDGSVSGRGE